MNSLSPENQARLKKIKILISDVDGVLTDGKIFWNGASGWTRFFHVKDGYGIRILMKSGIDFGVISGGNSDDVRARMEGLGVKYLHLGDENKVHAFTDILKQTGYSADQAAYVGDELFDLPVLERVGFSASVPDAVEEVRARVHYVTKTPGGLGAIREIIDLLRASQGKPDPLL